MTVSLRLQYLRYIVVKLAGLSNFFFWTQCVFSNRCYILRGLSKVGDHLRLRLTPLHIHSLHRAGPWMEQRFALLHYQLCVVAQCMYVCLLAYMVSTKHSFYIYQFEHIDISIVDCLVDVQCTSIWAYFNTIWRFVFENTHSMVVGL